MVVMKFIQLFYTLILLTLFTTSNSLASCPKAIFGKNNPINLEVAATPKAIMEGLMYRTSLAPDSGMIFLFNPPQKVKFWMYHTLIPLDMIFIYNQKVVKISANVPPCKSEVTSDCPTYPSGDGIMVNEVIEVNANYCKDHNVKVGDTVTYKSP